MTTHVKTLALCLCAAFAGLAHGQSVEWISSIDNDYWNIGKTRLDGKPDHTPDLSTGRSGSIVLFRDWGTCFNELDWDALNLLTRDEQDKILHDVFSPEGDLRITRGRISMGANDYSRSWYSCDEVKGDFELRYFNIDRDKQTVIPFIRAAQKFNHDMTFWISPWCPPSWMKINGDYPVLSSKFNNLSPETDYLLYGNTGGKTDPDEMKLTGERKDKFPRQLATTDYMIQDPRYLKAYAGYFCKFIDAYKAQGVPIDMVIYQNEAYSYTPYPGCAWTAEGTIRFNKDYLAPALKRAHPDVRLYIGTFNTNRLDHVEKILADSQLRDAVSGVAFQWEGREILPSIRSKYPDFSYICSESECGWGSFDWKAAEHTFELINHYLGNGCNEYNLWNFILSDNGESPWGWKQNALIRVDSKARTYLYTPEYYAVKHYSRYISKGAEIIACKPDNGSGMPVLAVRTPEGNTVIVAANFTDGVKPLTVDTRSKYLNVDLAPHSFNTFVIK